MTKKKESKLLKQRPTVRSVIVDPYIAFTNDVQAAEDVGDVIDSSYLGGVDFVIVAQALIDSQRDQVMNDRPHAERIHA